MSSARTWTGDGWTLTATPGTDPHLYAFDAHIAVDAVEIAQLCEALLGSADDGALRVVVSGSEPRSVYVLTRGGRLHIHPDDRRAPIDVPRGEARALALALLDAEEHASSGPCPHCGVSIAGDHAPNGCSEGR
jgi:hypothetical protein